MSMTSLMAYDSDNYNIRLLTSLKLTVHVHLKRCLRFQCSQFDGSW